MELTRSLSGEVIFETERLRCRRWLPSDLDAIFEVYSDVEGARWVGDGLPTEVKYAFRRSHWGLGLASEAVPALLAFGARSHALTRVIATVAPENKASQHVLHKAGMVFVEVAHDEDHTPVEVFEWHATKCPI